MRTYGEGTGRPLGDAGVPSLRSPGAGRRPGDARVSSAGGRVERRRRRGRVPIAASRHTDGWKPTDASARSTRSTSSPCSMSVTATRRARLRARSIGPSANTFVSHSACRACRSTGSRFTWRRFTGGRLRRTRTIASGSLTARSNCSSRARLRRSGELVPSRAEAEALRRGGDVEGDAVGRPVEPVGEVAHQQHARRTERREPERLDVPRTRVVPEHVEDRIAPRLHHHRRHTSHLRSCENVSRGVIVTSARRASQGQLWAIVEDPYVRRRSRTRLYPSCA